jgi:hypothetical protein
MKFHGRLKRNEARGFGLRVGTNEDGSPPPQGPHELLRHRRLGPLKLGALWILAIWSHVTTKLGHVESSQWGCFHCSQCVTLLLGIYFWREGFEAAFGAEGGRGCP